MPSEFLSIHFNKYWLTTKAIVQGRCFFLSAPPIPVFVPMLCWYTFSLGLFQIEEIFFIFIWLEMKFLKSAVFFCRYLEILLNRSIGSPFCKSLFQFLNFFFEAGQIYFLSLPIFFSWNSSQLVNLKLSTTTLLLLT